ncbi:MAG: hypothetical protein KTR30_20325 [Saprospiraceae bacterium]|nr:hypothetical protein [Saprospiraceae bacterium]
MKTYKLILTVTLVALSLLSSRAISESGTLYDPHSIDIPAFIVQAETAPQKISFMASNLQKRPTKISLEDEQGKVLFKAKVRNRNTYGKTFDMSTLAKGTYRIIIEQSRGQRIIESIYLKGTTQK